MHRHINSYSAHSQITTSFTVFQNHIKQTLRTSTTTSSSAAFPDHAAHTRHISQTPHPHQLSQNTPSIDRSHLTSTNQPRYNPSQSRQQTTKSLQQLRQTTSPTTLPVYILPICWDRFSSSSFSSLPLAVLLARPGISCAGQRSELQIRNFRLTMPLVGICEAVLEVVEWEGMGGRV